MHVANLMPLLQLLTCSQYVRPRAIQLAIRRPDADTARGTVDAV
ncbi:hypothetical protein B0G81_6785 [Paraburkholderia sp. BL6665CI2N2]|nr:hypothetical protein B0G81_6785 [Paraburkholderia sp. BL6665CI2N2]